MLDKPIIRNQGCPRMWVEELVKRGLAKMIVRHKLPEEIEGREVEHAEAYDDKVYVWLAYRVSEMK